MQLFTVTTSVTTRQEAEQFCALFDESASKWNQGKSMAMQFRSTYQYGRVTVCCESDQVTGLSSRAIKGLKCRAAEIITDHVLKFKEPELLSRLISKDYSFQNQEQISILAKLALQVLDGASDVEVHTRGREHRMASLYNSFQEYVLSNYDVDVDGWLNFRLPGYMGELREAIEVAVDEYLLDKQYEEFISLLKYFVQMQDIRMPVVHLKQIKGSDFQIFDDKMLPLAYPLTPEGITVKMIDQEIQMEDAVVSSLISLSPAKIIIHAHDPELRMILTIFEIFGERAQLYSEERTSP